MSSSPYQEKIDHILLWATPLGNSAGFIYTFVKTLSNCDIWQIYLLNLNMVISFHVSGINPNDWLIVECMSLPGVQDKKNIRTLRIVYGSLKKSKAFEEWWVVLSSWVLSQSSFFSHAPSPFLFFLDTNLVWSNKIIYIPDSGAYKSHHSYRNRKALEVAWKIKRHGTWNKASRLTQ